jgi:hypothetical protein
MTEQEMAAELLSLNCAGGGAGAVLRAATLPPRYQEPPTGVLPDQSSALPSTSMDGSEIHLEVDSVSPLPLRLFPFRRHEVEMCWTCPRVPPPTLPPGVLRPMLMFCAAT